MLITVILAVSLFAAGAVAYKNDWDAPLLFACHRGHVIREILSNHDNSKEDRRWMLDCGPAPGGSSPTTCHWSDYANDWDEPVDFSCPPDFVISGISSYHDNSKEDRRTKFKCCNDKGYRTHSCSLTPYLNDFDGVLVYKVPIDRAMVGWTSVHSNPTEDRRHRFRLCSYTKFNSTQN